MAESLKGIVTEAERARNAFSVSGSALEKMKAELKEIESGLDKFGKEFAQGAAPLQIPKEAEASFKTLVTRHAELQASIKGTAAATKGQAQAEKDAGDTAEQHAQVIGQVAAARRQAIEGVIEGLRDEVNTLSMSTNELELHKLASLGAGEGTLRLAKDLQGTIDRLKDFKDMVRETAEAEAILFEGAGPRRALEDQAQRMQDFHLLQRELGREAATAAEQTARANERIGQETLGMIDGLSEALRRGGSAWEDFGNSVVRMFLKIAMEQSHFEEKIGDWLQKGLGLVLKLFSAAGGATIRASPAILGAPI